MFKKSCLILVSTAVFSLAGCASPTEPEPTATQEDALLGALTSPIGVKNRHLVGTWKPYEPGSFHGSANAIHFTEEDGAIHYRVGAQECAAPCETDGTSFVTRNPVVWFIAGTYVQFQPRSDKEDSSLFISRRLSGEIRLVDLSSWDWHLGRYANTWRRDPPLTVGDL